MKILESLPNSAYKWSWYNRLKKTTCLKYLKVFFSIKFHKYLEPLRPIVDETGTWQVVLGEFLQKYLKILRVDDPYRVTNFDSVVEVIGNYHDVKVKIRSYGAVDMFFNLDHTLILSSVTDAIGDYGVIKFRNEVGLVVNSFIELIKLYLQSSSIKDENYYFTQKSGVCKKCF